MPTWGSSVLGEEAPGELALAILQSGRVGGGWWVVGVEWLAHRWKADEFYLSSELVEQVPPVTLEFRMRQNEDAGGGAGIPDREGSGAISVEGQGYYSK